MTHRTPVRMSRLTLGLLAALAAAPAFAQSTSSGITGSVTDTSGQPVAGAEVVITHVESGTVSRSTTDASGRYNARGLRVGGPYSITITKAGTGIDSEEGVFLELNQVSTVDGMSQGDPFGLNANGMPYTGTPISVDTIAAYDLKVSDYDVASDTVGATINAVTKSGTNEFHGSVYYAVRDADWMGDIDGQEYGGFDKDETQGFTLGGPILKDRLFFFAGYEEQTIENFGGASNSDGLANGDVTQADIDQAIAIATSLGLQPGSYGATGTNLENKRYLAKIDWNISDWHRASLTYQQTEEFRPSPYDQFPDTVVLSSHWYNIDNIT